jgi:hypothetical protein
MGNRCKSGAIPVAVKPLRKGLLNDTTTVPACVGTGRCSKGGKPEDLPVTININELSGEKHG